MLVFSFVLLLHSERKIKTYFKKGDKHFLLMSGKTCYFYDTIRIYTSNCTAISNGNIRIDSPPKNFFIQYLSNIHYNRNPNPAFYYPNLNFKPAYIYKG